MFRWWLGLRVLTGPARHSRLAGQPGVDGPRGSMWFTGNGDPTLAGDFIIGDMYLDQSNGNVWRWEGNLAWVRQ